MQAKQDFRQGRVSIAKEYRRQTIIRRNLERLVLREVNKIFRRWLSVTLYLLGETSTFDVNVARGRLNEDLIPTMQRLYRRIFQTLLESNVDKFEKQEEAIIFGRNVNFEELVEDYFSGRELVLTGISARVANQIDTIIQRGRADGLTLPEIARNIQRTIGTIVRSRAMMIARTETHNAASFANHRYYEAVQDQLQNKMVKRWVATADNRTRSFHASVNGQVRDMDQDFDVGGTKMSYPGDPRGGARNVINCRCVVVYVDEQDLFVEADLPVRI